MSTALQPNSSSSTYQQPARQLEGHAGQQVINDSRQAGNGTSSVNSLRASWKGMLASK
jgi:hypothetical protein